MVNNQNNKLEHYIKNTQDELKDYYNGLNGKYQGYIQLSDKRIEHIFQNDTALPKWDSLHNGVNYILELALFDTNTQKSILVRQTNEKWLVLEKFLTDNELNEADKFYTVKENLQAKIAQIWEEKEDGFCNNLPTQTLQTLLFAGFENKGGKS